MNFATQQFVIFYAAVFVAYWLMRPFSARKVLLLVASYYFYMSWNPYLVTLIWASTVLDFTVGKILARSSAPRVRKWALIASCIGNLGLLGVFKYANFFADSLQALAGQFGWTLSHVELNIILPVGISFYTFQTLSYTIDLYRKRIEPCHNFVDFALFVAFFPQLVAGPIVRASVFLPQLQTAPVWKWDRVRTGLLLIIYGMAKKVVVADHLALIADTVFGSPEKFGFWGSWFGTLAFTFQIYCDFSGYSDIAIGAARLLGFELMKNFDHPYLAQSIQEFWQRWHISLSSWLRDYLYIPLGGNRHGTQRTYRNLMITMLLGGLWHGAAWTFVAWGAYQGILLSLNRLIDSRYPLLIRRETGTPVAAALRLFVTFVLVCFGWVLFRAESFGDIQTMTAGMCGLRGFASTEVLRLSALWLIGLGACGHVVASVRARSGIDLTAPLVVKSALITGCLVGILAFWEAAAPFIYFQF